MTRIVLVIFLLWFKAVDANEIHDLRIWPAPDHTKLVLDLAGEIDYSIQYSRLKSRVLIKLPNTSARKLLDRKLHDEPRILRIRSKKLKNQLQLALDLKKAVRLKSFMAQPNAKYGYRLIIDIEDAESATRPVKSLPKVKKFIVAIDAGHGGEDPGATAADGGKEKTVVFNIARELYKNINNSSDMRAIMIREGDYYLSLKNRVKLAVKSRADIFVSIHADAYRTAEAKGASVYVLSKRGASSAGARWLAAKENSTDTFGGVQVAEKPDSVLDFVLSDLVASANYKGSKDAARIMVNTLRKDLLVEMHSNRVEEANFFVLKQNSIPALLIETGFMSNPDEAKYLQTIDYQRQIAHLIYAALVEYSRFQGALN